MAATRVKALLLIGLVAITLVSFFNPIKSIFKPAANAVVGIYKKAVVDPVKKAVVDPIKKAVADPIKKVVVDPLKEGMGLTYKEVFKPAANAVVGTYKKAVVDPLKQGMGLTYKEVKRSNKARSGTIKLNFSNKARSGTIKVKRSNKARSGTIKVKPSNKAWSGTIKVKLSNKTKKTKKGGAKKHKKHAIENEFAQKINIKSKQLFDLMNLSHNGRLTSSEFISFANLLFSKMDVKSKRLI